MTQLRADFARREVVALDREPWRPSPSPGVDRRMLDRVGDEVARATSVVRYAPGSRFDSHTHDLGEDLVRWAPGTVFQPHTHYGGEEILVLEGVFSDEHGDYPAGTWLRSPHLSRHHPHSDPGCLIYVKVGHLAPVAAAPAD